MRDLLSKSTASASVDAQVTLNQAGQAAVAASKKQKKGRLVDLDNTTFDNWTVVESITIPDVGMVHIIDIEPVNAAD